MPRSQNTRMSEPIDGMARPQPFIVISAPDPSLAITAPRMSTAEPSSSSHAATSVTSSPARSATVLSMWAPVSNMKPPPEIAGSVRHVPSAWRRQSCHTRAFTLRIAPSSPALIIAAAARIRARGCR